MRQLSESTIQRYLRSTNVDTRIAIAERHDWTPSVEDVRRGISDIHAIVRAAWARRMLWGVWERDMIEQLLQDPSLYVQKVIIANATWSPSVEEWQRGRTHPNADLRAAWYGRTDWALDHEVIEAMVTDTDARVRQRLAERLRESEAFLRDEVCERLLNDPVDAVRVTTIKNWPRPFPAKTIEWGLTHPSAVTRIGFIEREDWVASQEIIERGLSIADNTRVTGSVAVPRETCAWIRRSDFVVSPERLRSLLGSAHAVVRRGMSTKKFFAPTSDDADAGLRDPDEMTAMNWRGRSDYPVNASHFEALKLPPHNRCDPTPISWWWRIVEWPSLSVLKTELGKKGGVDLSVRLAIASQWPGVPTQSLMGVGAKDANPLVRYLWLSRPARATNGAR